MAKKPIDPTAITIDQLAKTLLAAGSQHASPESIRDDVEAGAPTNTDGTINLLHYAAWLVKEMGHAKP